MGIEKVDSRGRLDFVRSIPRISHEEVLSLLPDTKTFSPAHNFKKVHVSLFKHALCDSMSSTNYCLKVRGYTPQASLNRVRNEINFKSKLQCIHLFQKFFLVCLRALSSRNVISTVYEQLTVNTCLVIQSQFNSSPIYIFPMQ